MMEKIMTEAGSPDSWKQAEARHLPAYEDQEALAAAEEALASHPPLVFAGEARALKEDLAEVAADPATGDVYALRGPSFASVQGHLESILSRDGIHTLHRLAEHALG